MAIMIPETIPNNSTAGEKRLFKLLRSHLPENWVVYYEASIDNNYPDYIILAPELGLLVLEVKDFKPSTILDINPKNWKIKIPNGKIEQIKDPLRQAREYTFNLIKKLESEPRLQEMVGGIGRFKLKYAYGVVLTRINSVYYYESGLDDVIPDNLVFREEEITDSNDDLKGHLYEKISGMFRYKPHVPMTEEDINTIRYHLFPEVRLGNVKAYSEENLRKMRSLPVMDLYQETLAKQMGNGHRLIKGVAGSGKTIVLVARIKKLALENPDWKILILIFGVTLSASIRDMVNASGELPNVEVMTFGEFIIEKFQMYDDESLDSYLDAAERKEVTLPIYDSIAIDEMQDWKSSWLRLVTGMINPETMSLLFTEDRAQDIFRRKISYLQQSGLDFRGRSRILKINYRNTRQVLDLAWRFYSTFNGVEDPEVIKPESANRQGNVPMFRKFENFDQESTAIAKQISWLGSQGVAAKDIAILYRVRTFNKQDYLEILTKKLNEYSVPYTWVTKDRKSKAEFKFSEETVKILTLDSSKGLDFKYVFIMGIDNLPLLMKGVEPDRESSLLYIGMTRAIETLYITSSGTSDFVEFFMRGGSDIG